MARPARAGLLFALLASLSASPAWACRKHSNPSPSPSSHPSAPPARGKPRRPSRPAAHTPESRHSSGVIPSFDAGHSWPNAWVAMEERVVVLINRERALGATCGGTVFAPAPPLEAEPRLVQAARAHTRDMATAGFFSHTNLRGQSPFDRIRQTGYAFRAAAENISAGRSTPEDVVAGWMSSPGHCANIMNPIYADVGIGYFPANDAYGHYWTQTFGHR